MTSKNFEGILIPYYIWQYVRFFEKKSGVLENIQSYFFVYSNVFINYVFKLLENLLKKTSLQLKPKFILNLDKKA